MTDSIIALLLCIVIPSSPGTAPDYRLSIALLARYDETRTVMLHERNSFMSKRALWSILALTLAVWPATL
jgi:hypothetical protein